MIEKLKNVTGLDIYEASVHEAGGVTYFLGRGQPPGRAAAGKFVGAVGPSAIIGDRAGELAGRPVCLGPLSGENAGAIRAALPWTAPRCVGLATSIGLGDRLGLATPGHIRAVRQQGRGLTPFLAQQSIREMTRTQRSPRQVMDAATWGVLQEGYRGGFGSDADHLQKPEDIDATLAQGFTMFTIDPGAHVDNEADTLGPDGLADRFESFQREDMDLLQTTPGELKSRYVGRRIDLEGGEAVELDEVGFLRAVIKYGRAVAHTVRMYRHLKEAATREFELEVSVDETESPTSAAEHYFFASELKRLGVQWVSMAPRFVGRMEKGVDYIGDLGAFRESFERHVAVMRTLGPYKISIHSGSDKFSLYPIVAEVTDGLVHLKTAGTSYLEALRAIARTAPALFREIYTFARDRYEEDKKTYHVSADMAKVPPAEDLDDAELADRIDDFDTRQALHVTFGSVLTADEGGRFRPRIYDALQKDEEAHYAALAQHLGRHAAPFARG